MRFYFVRHGESEANRLHIISNRREHYGLTPTGQQQVLVQYGFRSIDASVDLQTVPNSPWNQKIPGAIVQPTGTILPLPERQIAREVMRQWERAN